MNRLLLTALEVALRNIAQEKWHQMWWPLITNVWPEGTTEEDKKQFIQKFLTERAAIYNTGWGFNIYP